MYEIFFYDFKFPTFKNKKLIMITIFFEKKYITVIYMHNNEYLKEKNLNLKNI